MPTYLTPGIGSAEVVGDAPDRRVEILSDDDTLHATWSRFAPGREGADLHVHYEHTDLFYVLQGELTLRLGPEGIANAVPAGTLARVPAGIVHGFRNGGDAELRHLNFHAPGQGFADYMRALRDGGSRPYDQFDPPDDGGRDPSDAVIGQAEVAVDVPGLHATLLADVEDVTIAEVTAAPGRPRPTSHAFEQVRSLFVLDGKLALTSADGDGVARAGSWVQVPAGLAHAIAVAGSQPLRFLDIHSPGCGVEALPVMAAKEWWTAGPA